MHPLCDDSKEELLDRYTNFSGKSCVLTRNYPQNPALQPIKGIIIFNSIDEMPSKAEALLKTLCCEVVSTHENRFTVKTSRGNLQSIKQRWLDNKLDSPINREMSACVSQIIIGGAAN